ncbi:MAG: hypothetical protein FJ135_09450 [Deltaproteobacteria bacterium]|nr:hypothetical protein [Deltaproteobacteria bacterium]
MTKLRVLAYLNTKKWTFSIEAKEGADRGRVIAEVDELVLRKASYSRNMRKTGAVFGLWDSKLRPGEAEREVFGYDENAYGGQAIKFDFEMKKYIEDDFARALQNGEDPSIHMELEKDPSFKKEVTVREMELLYLRADEDSQEIKGSFCNWKRGYRRTEPLRTETSSGLDEENRDKLFPKGTDPEEIIGWGQGFPTDQIQEIKKRADTEDIRVAVFYRNHKRGFITIFLGSMIGIVCHDTNSIELSFSGQWNDEDECLLVEYPERVVCISLDGSEEVLESWDDTDNDE